MSAPFHVTDVSPTGYVVPINTNILVGFNEAIDQGSISDLVLTLTTDEGYVPEHGRIWTSGSLTQLALEPDGLLRRFTRYRAMLPVPGIKSKADGDYLEEPYVWRFTTADTVDASGQTVFWEGDTEKELDTLGTTNVLKVALTDGTEITDGKIKVPSGQIGLDITFNAGPSGTLEWLSGYMTLTASEVLGYDFLDGEELATTFELLQAIEGTSSVINLRTKNDTSIGMADNAEYTLTVKKGVQASGYTPLVSDHVISWTTRFYPVYSTSVLVRLLSGPFIQDIPDDTVNRHILSYSRRATLLNGNKIFEPVPYYVTDYVTTQVAANLVRNEYSARAGSTGQIHLGDFTRNIAFKDVSGLMDDLLVRLQELADEALGLIQSKGRGIRPLSVVRYKHSLPSPGTTWSRQLDVVPLNYTGQHMPWTSLFESGIRYAVYEKYLETNQIPSRIQWDNYVYTLTT